MGHTFYFSFDTDELYYKDFAYTIEESLQDIYEYEFEKTYFKKYDSGTWYLECGARDLYNKLEVEWNKNTLDSFHYYVFNFNFIDWVKNKYYQTAYYKCLEQNGN